MKDLFKLTIKLCFIPLLLIFIKCVYTNNSGKPDWIDSPYSVYNRSQYVTVLGHSSNREIAEKNAFANLSAYFGQSIYADQQIINTYYESIRNGVTLNWNDDIGIYNSIRTSTTMDLLIGAEIGDVWHDTRNNTYYAVAVMERSKTIQSYTNIIRSNLDMISNLINISQIERNTLESFSRFQFAATIADMNTNYANILTLLDTSFPIRLTTSDEYRLIAQDITRSIPINVRVINDKSNRIQSSFANVLSNIGFRSGGFNSRYALDVYIVNTPANNPDNPFIFSRMDLTANLIDTFDNTILLPYSFSVKDGHSSIEEAENRTYILAERRIIDEYNEVLSSYLSRLLPNR